jgi:hypothetical protein
MASEIQCAANSQTTPRTTMPTPHRMISNRMGSSAWLAFQGLAVETRSGWTELTGDSV